MAAPGRRSWRREQSPSGRGPTAAREPVPLPGSGRRTELSDLELAAAAGTDDREAMEILLRRHYPRVYAVCRRLAGNDADAADAAQEALIAISRGLKRFDARSSFTTWSYRVATSACLDELRRRQRRSADELTDRLSGGPLDPVGEQISARLDLDAALAELPEEFRVPVVLRDQAGLSYDEISDVLHIPPGTVRSRIARGRRRLAETLSAGNQTPASDRLNGD